MFDSLQPHGLQHTRLPGISPTCSYSCPSSWLYHPIISSSVVSFSSCFQSFPASGSFLMTQFFTWGGQSIVVSASTLVLPMKIQNWFPLLVWTPCSSRDSQDSSPTPQFKSINYLALSFLYGPTLTYVLTTGKTVALNRWTFVAKGMSPLFFFFNWRLIT